MSHLLEIDDVVIRYGGIEAVKGVSLAVAEGELVALLGANGAGKSSLLGAVVGLVPVDAGSIRFDGAELRGLKTERIVKNGVTLTPEGRRVFPQLSVADNLRIGAATIRDAKEERATLERALELFPVLRERLRQSAGTLSGGEQQMLAIARSLMAQPKLLLLDEPSLGLAPVMVDRIFELVVRLREGGTTILLVEQNASRALQIADRAYIMASGAIELQGPAAELLASPEVERVYLGGEVEAWA
jgi:branched-chain amino acid transport system ATP-binding protein